MAWSTPSTRSSGYVVTSTNWNELVNDLIFLSNPPRAKVHKVAAQTLANNTLTSLTFVTEDYDTDTIHSNASNTERLTATTAGLYVVTASVFFDANATGYREIRLYKNGSGSTWLNGALTTGLAATDYVEVYALQTSGGNLDVLGSAALQTNFEMRLIAQ